MIANRKDYRNTVFALLEPLLIGAGKPCLGGFNGQFADFAGLVPAFVVFSRGAGRTLSETYGVREDSRLYLGVDVYVPFINPQSPGWNEQMAEDTLDDIEQIIAGWVIDNPTRNDAVAPWDQLSLVNQGGFSSFTDALKSLRLGGNEYRRERYTISLKVTRYVKPAA
jgi:hypothetical protein